MILGVTKKSWIESLGLKEQDGYLELVDKLIIVTDEYQEHEPPFYFVKGDYDKILSLLRELALCKAYPQRTLYSVNYSLVEIKEGMTPDKLKGEWLDELHARNLV